MEPAGAGGPSSRRRSSRNAQHPHLRADRHLERIDQPVPPPADREQPSPRSLEEPGPRIGTLSDRAVPPVEERSRREHVRRERTPRTMLARVLQRVNQRVAHRARRRELERVVALKEDPPDTLPQAVEPARDPRREAVHPARERALVVRLYERMDVVLLDGVFDDPEVLAPPRSDG